MKVVEQLAAAACEMEVLAADCLCWPWLGQPAIFVENNEGSVEGRAKGFAHEGEMDGSRSWCSQYHWKHHSGSLSLTQHYC